MKHILGHKTDHNKFERSEITQSMSKHNKIKIEMNNSNGKERHKHGLNNCKDVVLIQ